MAVVGMPVLSSAERAQLEHDYRYGPDRLVSQRSHIVLLATELDTQIEVARVVHCSTATVSERTVRRGLESLDYVCRRPTWTVRHKAEEQPDYLPKRRGSRPS